LRIRTLVVIASVAALSASPAFAVGSHQVGVDLGASVPSGDFSDAASTGMSVGGVYQYSMMMFAVGGEVKYHAWSASSATKEAVELANGAGSELKFSAMEYDVYGKVNLPIASMPMLSPYVKAGGGWYAPTAKLTSPLGDTSTSNSDFGLMGGLGFDVNTHTPLKFGMGADYHRVKDSDTDFFSVSARVMYSLH